MVGSPNRTSARTFMMTLVLSVLRFLGSLLEVEYVFSVGLCGLSGLFVLALFVYLVFLGLFCFVFCGFVLLF